MMTLHRCIVALCAAALAAASIVSAASAGQGAPPFASPATRLGPLAAPNPPYVAIRRSGSSAIIEWSHPDSTLTAYEVWRGELPYLEAASEHGEKLSGYSFSEGVYAEFAPFSYADNGSCGYFIAAGQQLPCAPQSPPAQVVGDPDRQFFWIVRAGNGEFADSNLVGEFDYRLQKGG